MDPLVIKVLRGKLWKRGSHDEPTKCFLVAMPGRLVLNVINGFLGQTTLELTGATELKKVNAQALCYKIDGNQFIFQTEARTSEVEIDQLIETHKMPMPGPTTGINHGRQEQDAQGPNHGGGIAGELIRALLWPDIERTVQQMIQMNAGVNGEANVGMGTMNSPTNQTPPQQHVATPTPSGDGSATTVEVGSNSNRQTNQVAVAANAVSSGNSSGSSVTTGTAQVTTPTNGLGLPQSGFSIGQFFKSAVTSTSPACQSQVMPFRLQATPSSATAASGIQHRDDSTGEIPVTHLHGSSGPTLVRHGILNNSAPVAQRKKQKHTISGPTSSSDSESEGQTGKSQSQGETFLTRKRISSPSRSACPGCMSATCTRNSRRPGRPRMSAKVTEMELE